MSEPRTAAGRALLADLNAGAISVPEAGDAILAIEAEAATIDREALAAALQRVIGFLEGEDAMLEPTDPDRAEIQQIIAVARAILDAEAER